MWRVENLNRSAFLRTSAISSVGLSLAPMAEAQAQAAIGKWLWAIGSFAASVGSAVIAESINRYIQNTQDPDHRAQVESQNQRLADSGYSDTSRSVVRCNVFDDNSQRIYYPLVYVRCGCLQFVAPFFNRESNWISNIDGPHLVGLALAAKETQDPCGVLFPTAVDPNADRDPRGDPRNGYDRPLTYQSNIAQVAVDYSPTSANTASVIVEAKSNTTGQLLLGRRYNIGLTAYMPKGENAAGVFVEAGNDTTGQLLLGRRYDVRLA
jgi:hypothetical protein